AALDGKLVRATADQRHAVVQIPQSAGEADGPVDIERDRILDADVAADERLLGGGQRAAEVAAAIGEPLAQCEEVVGARVVVERVDGDCCRAAVLEGADVGAVAEAAAAEENGPGEAALVGRGEAIEVV